MRFLLIAPVHDAVLQYDDALVPPHVLWMRNRTSYYAGLLTQKVEAMPRCSTPERAADQGITVECVECRQVRDISVMCIVVRVVPDSPAHSMPVPELEDALTSCAADLGKASNRPWNPLWVNRMVIATAEERPRDWLDDTARKMPLSVPVGAAVHVGWGNSQLELPGPADDSILAEIAAGMVDAQCLWAQLDSINGDASQGVLGITMAQGPGGAPGTDPVDLANRLSRELSLHRIYRDEVDLRIQGSRKNVVLAALESWNYVSVAESVARRVCDLEKFANQFADKKRRKYQSLVELTLLALSLISLLALVVSLIQTAFSGGVSDLPGGPTGVMSFLRAINLDAALIVTVLISTGVYLAVYLLKRRADA